jgi:DNA-binding transcriptional ArsR family regulator
MSANETQRLDPPDPFELADASIEELAAALETAVSLPVDEDIAPLTEQIAGLILSEAIHLIRMGSRAETAAASDTLSQLVVSDCGEDLERGDSEAYRLISTGSVALSAATPASSKGGARMMLRSWSGRARKAIELLMKAPDQRLYRSDLRAGLQIEDESHLSHLLGDLEAARLIIRVREGREVLVRLGPAVERDEAREAIGRKIERIFVPAGPDPGLGSDEKVATNRLDAGSLVLSRPFDPAGPPPVENEVPFPTRTLCEVTALDLDDQEVLRPSTGSWERTQLSRSTAQG